MRVPCIYRLAPEGEFIHSVYDTNTGTIIGVESDLFTVFLDDTKFIKESYYINGPFDVALMEQYMVVNPECSLVIEVSGVGFYAFQDTLVGLFIGDNWDTWSTTFVLDEPVFSSGEYVCIGLRPTKVKQVGVHCTPYNMIFDINNQKVISDEGEFKLGFDITKVSTDYSRYAGLKKMYDNKAFGIITYDGETKLVFKGDDDILYLE